MTTRFRPTKSTLRQSKLKWMNLLHHCHDAFCDCENGITHTILHIFEQENNHNFTPPEKDFIKSCLSGEGTTIMAGDHEEGFTEGDLEELFKEDVGEDATDAAG